MKEVWWTDRMDPQIQVDFPGREERLGHEGPTWGGALRKLQRCCLDLSPSQTPGLISGLSNKLAACCRQKGKFYDTAESEKQCGRTEGRSEPSSRVVTLSQATPPPAFHVHGHTWGPQDMPGSLSAKGYFTWYPGANFIYVGRNGLTVYYGLGIFSHVVVTLMPSLTFPFHFVHSLCSELVLSHSSIHPSVFSARGKLLVVIYPNLLTAALLVEACFYFLLL